MNDHDPIDSMSTVTKLDAVMEALHTHCEHCTVSVQVLPAAGTRHVLGIDHEKGCPEYVD
ncbi:hypothetical protein GCM10027596_35770 [Nocardioides korecus]